MCGKVARAFLNVAAFRRFGAVIELVDQRALQLLHDTDQVDARSRRGMLGEKSRQLAEELDFLRELLAHVRALDLTTTLRPSRRIAACTCPRLALPSGSGLERLEQLADAGVKLFLDGLLDLLEVHRRDIVLKVLELLDVRPRQQIRAWRAPDPA